MTDTPNAQAHALPHPHGVHGSSRLSRRRALNCCAACAASAGVRARARRRRAPWAWVSLLCAAAALVPIAAMGAGGDEPSSAHAAPSPTPPAAAVPAVVVADAGPAPAAATARPVRKHLVEEAARTPAVAWNHSRARGGPNGGSLENGVRLPVQGVGFYTYNPATQLPPGGTDRQWGTASLVQHVLDVSAWWARTYPNQPRLGIGDLSRQHGGSFTGPGVGHASHQNGLDVDIRLPRTDGVEGPATAATYDRALTQALVDRLVAQGAQLVLIGGNLDLTGPSGVVMTWPAHDDHLHVRFPNPG